MYSAALDIRCSGRQNRSRLASHHFLPLFLRVLQDAFCLQPSPRFFKRPCLYAIALGQRHSILTKTYSIPRIRLVAVADQPKKQTPDKTIIPHRLPALILVLLARLHVEQPAARRIVMVFVCVRVAGPEGGCAGERALLLLLLLGAGGAKGSRDNLLARPRRRRDEAGGGAGQQRHRGGGGGGGKAVAPAVCGGRQRRAESGERRSVVALFFFTP